MTDKPVLWHNPEDLYDITTVYDPEYHQGWISLYAAPVRTKDLTDDEIWKALGAKSYDDQSERELADAISDARAVIAAHKEKNK